MLPTSVRTGMEWLRWHVKDKRDQYMESQELKDEDWLLMKWPSPPQLLLEYIDDLELKAQHAKEVLSKFDTFAKMETTNSGTEREREEHLANALNNLGYLVERFPEMHPEYVEEEDENAKIIW
jgi:hypothetical protein